MGEKKTQEGKLKQYNKKAEAKNSQDLYLLLLYENYIYPTEIKLISPQKIGSFM